MTEDQQYEAHRENQILDAERIAAGRRGSIGILDEDACPRCGGDGYFDQFMHIEKGRCFRCGGSGRK